MKTIEVAEILAPKLHSKFSVDENDCWNWTGCTTQGGYGVVRRKGVNYYTHRLMAAYYYPLFFKETDHVMHECDNRRCMNPNHLSLGDIRLNNQDMFQKGRARPNGKIINNYKGIPLDHEAPE